MRTKIRLDIYRQTVQLVIFFYLRLMFYAYVQRFDVTVTMQIFFGPFWQLNRLRSFGFWSVMEVWSVIICSQCCETRKLFFVW
jgi:hypothetical protein